MPHAAAVSVDREGSGWQLGLREQLCIIVVREKPTTSGPHNKAEKKGRTQKERKSNAGRKAKSGTVRQPRQLSLDVRTIQTLDAMGTNNSQLFETLLNQYKPFLNAWAELGYERYQEDESE